MLMFAMWYFTIGVGFMGALLIAFLRIRHTIENPISVRECWGEIVIWAVFWPIVLLGIIIKRGVAFLFTEGPFSFFGNSISKATEKNQNEHQALWDNPPICGQQVFARGINDSLYEAIPSTFIFDATELAACLANDSLSYQGASSDEAAMAKWLHHRDRELNVITKVPPQWSRISSVIQKVIAQGVGQAYCPTCKVCYPASQLVKPEAAYTAGWNFNAIHCPEQHLLHYSKGIHFSV
jgi:hypothetical protein